MNKLTEEEKARRRAERFAKPVAKSFGLASKGGNELKDGKTRREFFNTVKSEYKRYCIDNSEQEGLQLVQDVQSSDIKRTTSQILMSCRKLREGALASSGNDLNELCLFSVKIAILAKQPETFAPLIYQLLENKQVAKWHVLHLVHYTNEAIRAHQVNHDYNLKMDKIIRAWTTENWIAWNREYDIADAFSKRIMELGRQDLLKRAIKVIGSAYISMNVKDLENYTCSKWKEINKHCAWKLDESDKVVIRRISRKPSPAQRSINN